MNPMISLVATLLLSSLICSTANADPDRSLVRIEIADESSKVTASGGCRVNVVQAVMRSLKEAKRPCGKISVGPYLHLPAIQSPNSKSPSLTVCIDDRMEGGMSTAYIGISEEVPFEVVGEVADGLSKLGYENIRLISEEDLDELLRGN